MAARLDGASSTARARPGTISVIPDGCDACFGAEGTIEVSQVRLDDGRLQATAERVAGGRVVLVGRLAFADPTAAAIVELICREAAADGPTARLFLEQAVELLCVQLVRAHAAPGDRRPGGAPRGLADWQVKRVTGYMADHLDEDIGLDTLAALVRLSRFHFCTAFRLATGATPHEWLVARRIARARELLADTGRSVTEIALAVGYRTPSAFAVAFRKGVGMPPSQFRRALPSPPAIPDRADPESGWTRAPASDTLAIAGAGRPHDPRAVTDMQTPSVRCPLRPPSAPRPTRSSTSDRSASPSPSAGWCATARR